MMGTSHVLMNYEIENYRKIRPLKTMWIAMNLLLFMIIFPVFVAKKGYILM